MGDAGPWTPNSPTSFLLLSRIVMRLVGEMHYERCECHMHAISPFAVHGRLRRSVPSYILQTCALDPSAMIQPYQMESSPRAA